MSKLSKYYKVTRQILLEYVADQDPMKSAITESSYYIYTGLDNKTYYTEEIHNEYDPYINQGLYLRIPDQSDSEYMYVGIPQADSKISPTSLNMKNILDQLLEDGKILSYSHNNNVSMVYDKIKVHLVYGFTLDKLTGFNLQVSVLCNTLKPKQSTTRNHKIYDENNNPVFDTINVVAYDENNHLDNRKVQLEQLVNVTEDMILMDLYFPKELLQKSVKWHSSPIYQNGAFYDRYIEIDVPSAFYISLNSIVNIQAQNPYGYLHLNSDFDSIPYLTSEHNTHDGIIYNIPEIQSGKVGAQPKYAIIPENNEDRTVTYTIPENPEIIIAFSTTSDGNSTEITNNTVYYKQTYYQDPIDYISIKYKSNSDYFNIRILEDYQNNEILYYPVYGEGNDSQDLDIDVMNEIESGAIPMITSGFYNDPAAMDEFYELYGSGARQWIIYNDMSVTYNYTRIINQLDTENVVTMSNHERFTNIIDYTDKTLEDGQFWRSKFIPRVNTYNNYRIHSISILYTCRLVNRLNSVECIRTASLLIEHPERYVTKRIAINNVMTYKIVNKLENTNIISKPGQKEIKEKYIRSYYDATNIVISDTGNGSVYSQGQMNLKLKRTGTNYMFKLYYMNEDNIRIPYDLTGPYKYKLVFPANEGGKIEISSNIDSTDQNLEIGQIIFYINEEQVKRIMNVPEKDRYFAIVTDIPNKSQMQSTLYEGTVSYY